MILYAMTTEYNNAIITTDCIGSSEKKNCQNFNE